MKTVVRIIFIIGALAIILFAMIILFEESRNRGLIEAVDKDPTLWILIVAAFLALISMYFNVVKFTRNPRKQKFFKHTRIGDLIFALYLFGLNMLGLVDLTIRYFSSLNSPYHVSISVEVFIFYIAVILFSIAVFIDNIKFYKSVLRYRPSESIDDIGKLDP